MPKDLFSNHASAYAQFRPHYPQALFDYIVSFLSEKRMAWDCATGNGQAAVQLAPIFDKVIGTEISQAQLDNAEKKPNIEYYNSPSEHTPFADNSFDLITIATAYHWFNHTLFYNEATRVGKNNAIVAAWTYNTIHTDDGDLKKVYDDFYDNITKPYWEPERKWVDEEYKSIPFGFDPLPIKNFETVVEWNREQFKGYLGTWSAVRKFTDSKGFSPLNLIENKIDDTWKEKETKTIVFPICLRLGIITK